MKSGVRRTILQVNAIYLGAASCMGLIALDLRGVLLGTGPEARILAVAPDAAVGFFESHGLALILAITLWRAPAVRASHVTGAAACALLGTCNLVFWHIFTAIDALMLGYVTTTLHWTVAIAQFAAAIAAPAAAETGHPVEKVPAGSGV
jgi:hypothetical protein